MWVGLKLFLSNRLTLQSTMENHTVLEEVLADVCRRGDIATLQSILAKSPEADLNITTDGGLTLLMHALIGFGGKCVSSLLPKQTPSPHTHTRTHARTYNPQSIHCGCDLFYRGITILSHSMIPENSSTVQGCYETCQLLIEAGGAVLNLMNADTTYGRTAAHWAVQYKQHQILDMLIQAGKWGRSGHEGGWGQKLFWCVPQLSWIHQLVLSFLLEPAGWQVCHNNS